MCLVQRDALGGAAGGAERRLLSAASAPLCAAVSACRGESTAVLAAASEGQPGGIQVQQSSSSELNNQRLLQVHGLFEGETLHGVRRGSLQRDAALGPSMEAIGRHALHAPPYTTTEQYVDTSREVGGGTRLHNQKKRKAGTS